MITTEQKETILNLLMHEYEFIAEKHRTAEDKLKDHPRNRHLRARYADHPLIFEVRSELWKEVEKYSRLLYPLEDAIEAFNKLETTN
jgi:hypothetical protein